MNKSIRASVLSRRQVMIGAAGLTFAIAAPNSLKAAALSGEGPRSAMNPWISIATDGTITIMSAATEMGQGSMTSLPLIIAGLAISSTCGLICQAISTGYVTVTAKAGRSSAVGLYVTSFYVGGSFGAPLGGLAWHLGGWPACVALVAVMLAIMSAIVIFAWTPRAPAPTEVPPIEPP